MHYELEISVEALEELRALPPDIRKQIGQRLDRLEQNLAGDIKKLHGQSGRYRLRVGNFRILFLLKGNVIFVFQVRDRKNAYRD